MYNYKNILLFIIFYFSLIAGYILNENLNYGSYYDWVNAYVPVLKGFSKNFLETFLNYEKYGHRHSPLYLILLSYMVKLGISFDFVRLIHLHLCLSLIFLFYKCLKLKFKEINNNTLQLLSFFIFLSPTFRSLAIWPDSRIIGLIFFTLSIYFFLKFLDANKESYKFALYSGVSLIFSSYISPNFSLFSIFFYYFFFKNLKLSNFFYLIFISALLSMPMIYYLFVLDINFITAGKTPSAFGSTSSLNFNFSNKILIISTILTFHLLPVIFYLIDKKQFFLFLKKRVIVIFLFLILLIYFFNYEMNFTGGGIFFQISNILFNNNILFYLSCFFSLILIAFISKINFSNLLLIILTIFSNVQNSIYHKYYEPFFLLIIFLLFKNLNYKNFFSKKNNILYLYLFSLFYILLRLVKNFYFA